jgi:hypothetical protein
VPQCSTRHFDLCSSTPDFNASKYEKKPQETGDSASGTTFASELPQLLLVRGRIGMRSRWSPAHAGRTTRLRSRTMSVLALTIPVLMAAAGYSLLYLLLGGGLGGAILIFIVAKMLGR